MEYGGNYNSRNRIRDQHHSDGRQRPGVGREVAFESIHVSATRAGKTARHWPDSVRTARDGSSSPPAERPAY